MKKIDDNAIWAMPKAVRRTVRLPAVQVDGLPPEELKGALAYELEGETGIPAAEALVAWRIADEADPAMRAYEVAVVRRGAAGGAGGRAALLLGAALALVAAAGVGLDCALLSKELIGRRREAETCRRLQAELDGIASRTAANRAGIAAIRAEREAKVRVQENAAERRAAWAELLGALTEACGEDALLKRIASEGAFAANVEAVSLSPQEAVKVMVRLTKALEPKGWKLTAGPVKTRQPGTTVLFSVRVEFAGGAK